MLELCEPGGGDGVGQTPEGPGGVRGGNGGLKAVELAHPDIYVKGGDYRIEDLPEAKLVSTWGARTVTVQFEHERSTTALLKKVRGA